MFLYVHVPFCPSRCIYCDFTVVLNKHAPKTGGHSAFQTTLLSELTQRLQQCPTRPTIKGIYVGGGTPSLLPASFYNQLFDCIRQHAALAPNAEITLEANPNAIVDSPENYRAVGFNRVSLGVQSFQNNELKALSRNHSAAEAIATIHQLADGGFSNISLDLMYAFPRQTVISWKNTLDKALSLPITHLSFYGLQVEAATPMARLVQTPAYPLPDNDTNATMMSIVADKLAQASWHHYEISNACKPNFHSRHNLNYWQPWNDSQGQYLAVGPGAHGYIIHQSGKFVRTENSRDLATWQKEPIASCQTPVEPCHHRLENAFIFGLRTSFGVSLSPLITEFGQSAVRQIVETLTEKHTDHLIVTNNTIKLQPHAWPVCHDILADILTPM